MCSIGTTLAYQPNNADTMTDITADAVGELAGGVWLAAWSGHPRNHPSRTTTAHPFARENHVQ
jgi:hypothetical protein